jgi:F-type H+-transporting ATPase subunit epsilon
LDKTLILEIITVDKEIFNGEIISVTVPGTIGEFQVLYNHAPLVSTLEIGKIKIVEPQNKESIFAVSGGIIEVRENKVIILADAVEGQDEIDVSRAERAAEKAENTIESDIKINRGQEILALKRAKNRIKIAKATIK